MIMSHKLMYFLSRSTAKKKKLECRYKSTIYVLFANVRYVHRRTTQCEQRDTDYDSQYLPQYASALHSHVAIVTVLTCGTSSHIFQF
jgi:hypothetical protein